nr:MAG TPA_asm: hypothetical protein [Caudoviricetes sp.]
MKNPKEIKTYSDTYLYQKYSLYNKRLTDAIMKDPLIEKADESFKDVIYEIKRSRVSSALLTILTSRNTMLLECTDPLPRAFKVFVARDIKSKERNIKVFIDCTGVITKDKNYPQYVINETKLISYLINAGISMLYHKNFNSIIRVSDVVTYSTEAFSKLFTFIIDYLTKVSIQESSKIKVLYLSAMYFLCNILNFDPDEKRTVDIAKKVSGISEREANMLNILMTKIEDRNVEKTHVRTSDNPYENIKIFIQSLRKVMHFNEKVITPDMVVERWMAQYGPGTVFGLEYFPAFSAMITDAYIGGYLNQQKTIEKVLGTTLVFYSKEAISLIDRAISS